MSMFFADEPPDDNSPPRPRLRPGFRGLRRLLAVVAALVVVTLAVGAIYVGSVSRSFTDNVSRKELLPTASSSASSSLPGSPEQPAPPARRRSTAGAVNYVLMGSDSRNAADAGSGRSDTLMVLHLAADRESAHLISFPRDMWVSIPGHGKNKINAAFAFGGAPLTIQTLEEMLDLTIDHAALIDFQGLMGLTTELGGVTVYNKHASQSRGYVFPKGPIHIEGEEALAFVRERYDLPNGDLDRAERQRAVTQAIMAKGLSKTTIANPAKFTGFVSGLAKHLTVDAGLTDSEILRTARSLRLGPDDISSLQAPISGFGTINGQSVDVVDEAGMKELAQALADDTMAEYARSHPGG